MITMDDKLYCDYCFEVVESIYEFEYNGKEYYGHKRCCSALRNSLEKAEEQEKELNETVRQLLGSD